MKNFGQSSVNVYFIVEILTLGCFFSFYRMKKANRMVAFSKDCAVVLVTCSDFVVLVCKQQRQQHMGLSVEVTTGFFVLEVCLRHNSFYTVDLAKHLLRADGLDHQHVELLKLRK